MPDEPISSLLTRKQRDYVMGRKDPSNESDFRGRIRKRVYAGLRQDGIILPDMDPELRREIFREWENKNYREQSKFQIRDPDAVFSDEHEKYQFKAGLAGLLEFIIRGLEETDLADLEEILEMAMEDLARDEGKTVEQVELNVEYGTFATIEDTHQMLEEGTIDYEDLTITEFHQLIESGLMELEDFPIEFLESYMRAMDWIENMQTKIESGELEEELDELREDAKNNCFDFSDSRSM